MKASELMTRDVFFVDADEGLGSIWETMKLLGIRHVPVLESNRPVGMLSDRDILRCATAKGSELVVPDLKARAVMASPVVASRGADSLTEVGRKMLVHKIDSVAIVDEAGELVGLVTSTDFIHLALEREAHDLKSPPNWEFRVQKLRR